MFSYMVGACSLCKIEKPLPVLRDNYIICNDCNQVIDKDLSEFNTRECQRCFQYFSPIFGNDDSGEFWCKNCQPGGLCGNCHQAKPLPYIGEVNGFRMFLCQDCGD